MAKRQSIVTREETGFGDPLGEYAEGFNILQFINDSTPVDSPADPERNGFHEPSTHIPHQSNPNNNIIEGTWIHPQAPHQGQANNNYGQMINTGNGLMSGSVVLDNGVMYSTNGTRLQDSPPVTDISAGGSSASPSTTSDSPFSPDQYSNYLIPPGNIIFGIPDANGQILVSPDMANQQLNGRIVQNHSPQSDFRSPYNQPQSTPGSIISQVSPSAVQDQRFMQQQRPQQGQYPQEVYGSDLSLNTMPSAKRKRVDLSQVKEEMPSNRMYPSASARGTPALSCMDEFDENVNHRPIRFAPHIPESWTDVYDVNHQPLRNISTTVIADKGFNYSAADGCFVNQKKNHFQITAQIEVHEDSGPAYFRNETGIHQITEFKMAFCGVKAEMPTSEISINQSQTDRKPIQHEPVSLQIQERRVTKVTVPRLHFSKTTDNNHRKNGRPNPEQRYFLLVVKLVAHAADGTCSLIRAYQSEKVIVRCDDHFVIDDQNVPVAHFNAGCQPIRDLERPFSWPIISILTTRKFTNNSLFKPTTLQFQSRASDAFMLDQSNMNSRNFAFKL
uniref:NDT80 domain-containing protein n=1 Tax=Panagrellus redivivus TaxID=6233 RepID=A0A7E4VXJ4_PANRE